MSLNMELRRDVRDWFLWAGNSWVWNIIGCKAKNREIGPNVVSREVSPLSDLYKEVIAGCLSFPHHHIHIRLGKQNWLKDGTPNL